MVEGQMVPRHVGFIMDGNGRWAKNKNKPRNFGHVKGADNVETIVTACFERGIEVVTLYAFSTENWGRPQEEVDKIMNILGKFLIKYTKTLLNNKIRLKVSGDIERLSPELKELILSRIDLTKGFTKTLNIALNYGSRQELVFAVNKIIASKKETVREEDISANLYTAGLPDIDLVVRTSGEMRLSNFFLWQCAYSEFYFTDVLWPDFNEVELDKALECYNKRNRRFGKI